MHEKHHSALPHIILAALLLAVGSATSAAQERPDPKLLARTKVNQEQARTIALGKVPNGAVKSAELEVEKGELIWSFDLTTPGSKRVTEVGVNAVTGKVVEHKVETAKDEAKEQAEDKAKEKGAGAHHGKR